MAKKKIAPGLELPLSQATQRYKGHFIIQRWMGIPTAQAWPKKRTRKPTPAELEQREEFKRLVNAVKNVPAQQVTGARELAYGTKYTYRDVLSLLMVGKLITLANYGEIVSQYNLDILGTQPGMIIIRTAEGWIALAPGADAQVLKMIAGLPQWGDGAGITELTGDVIAGPGTGTQNATLSETGVTPGSYTLASIIVGEDGRITNAANGTAAGGITELTGDVTAGPGTGTQPTTLSPTGVIANTYNLATITVDAKGRITSASPNSPTSIIVDAGSTTRLHALAAPATIINNTSEQILDTYTLPANTLSANGMAIRLRVAAECTAVGNNRYLRTYFGATVFEIHCANSSQTREYMDVEIQRINSTQQKLTAIGSWGAESLSGNIATSSQTASEDITTGIVVKITGQQSTAAGTSITLVSNTITLFA